MQQIGEYADGRAVIHLLLPLSTDSWPTAIDKSIALAAGAYVCFVLSRGAFRLMRNHLDRRVTRALIAAEGRRRAECNGLGEVKSGAVIDWEKERWIS